VLITNLALNEAKRELLRDVINWWLEDMEAATQETEKDKIHTSVDEMLESISGLHNQVMLLNEIKEDLNGEPSYAG
jgi:hypothetical protein